MSLTLNNLNHPNKGAEDYKVQHCRINQPTIDSGTTHLNFSISGAKDRHREVLKGRSFWSTIACSSTNRSNCKWSLLVHKCHNCTFEQLRILPTGNITVSLQIPSINRVRFEKALTESKASIIWPHVCLPCHPHTTQLCSLGRTLPC